MGLVHKPLELVCLVFFAVFVVSSSVFAQESEKPARTSLFVVTDIAVDVTADNAFQAKQQAFEQVQRAAFERLVERMLSDDEMAALGEVEIEQISSLIQDFEIIEEKTSSVQYIGRYTFRFKENGMRQYLTGLGFGFSDVRSEPILILPLFREAYKTILWSYDNEWLRAWNRQGDLEGLVPIVVPIGDLEDVRDVGEDQDLSYTPEGMQRILTRYGATESVIAIAVIPKGMGEHDGFDPAQHEPLKVQMFRTDRANPEFVNELTINPPVPVGRDGLFDIAVSDVYKTLQRDWKAKTRVAMNEKNMITVRVPIKTLKQWAQTQKTLNSISVIDQVLVKKLSPGQALVDLHFQGRKSRLQIVLRDNGVTLELPPVDETSLAIDVDQNTHNNTVYPLYLNRFKP